MGDSAPVLEVMEVAHDIVAALDVRVVDPENVDVSDGMESVLVLVVPQ